MSVGRVCPKCAFDMLKSRTGSFRWRCPRCNYHSEPDGYLESVANGASELPEMPSATGRWVLRFDDLPLSPNDKQTLRDRMNNRKRWREWAAVMAQKHGIPQLGRVRLSAVIYRRAVGMADEDNDRARFKPVQDGLVRAGILSNDTYHYVTWGSVREERGPRGFALVIEAL